MNLSTAPTKTPLEKDGIMIHLWQRWFSDLYDFLKKLNSDIVSLFSSVAKINAVIDNDIAPVSHVPVTVENTSSVDMTISGQNISAEVVEAGIDHSQLYNLNSTNVNHLTDIELVGLETLLMTLVEYSDNDAALSAGLAAGRFYRNGDFVCVVH